MIYTSQPPSMAYGYASPASPWWPYAKYPELHRGRVAGYCSSLGNTADRLWDFAGNGNHGTMMPTFASGPSWVVSEGKYANLFDGVNDYVDAGLAAGVLNITNDKLTISTWVNFSSITSAKCWMISKMSPSDGAYGFFYEANSLGPNYQKLVLGLKISGGSWGDNVSSATVALSAGTWYHLAVVYSGVDIGFYVNGAILGSPVAKTGNIASSSNTLKLGWEDGWNSQRLSGTLDDVQIYNRALSQNEITQLYQLGRGGSYAIDYEMMMEDIAAGGPFPHFIRRSQQLSGGLVAC